MKFMKIHTGSMNALMIMMTTDLIYLLIMNFIILIMAFIGLLITGASSFKGAITVLLFEILIAGAIVLQNAGYKVF